MSGLRDRCARNTRLYNDGRPGEPIPVSWTSARPNVTSHQDETTYSGSQNLETQEVFGGAWSLEALGHPIEK